MHGQPGHNTRPHARLPHIFVAMDAWMTSQLNLSLIRKLRGSLMCFAELFWHGIQGCFYNQALADVQSTSAGIKCLHCYGLVLVFSPSHRLIRLYISLPWSHVIRKHLTESSHFGNVTAHTGFLLAAIQLTNASGLEMVNCTHSSLLP